MNELIVCQYWSFVVKKTFCDVFCFSFLRTSMVINVVVGARELMQLVHVKEIFKQADKYPIIPGNMAKG